MVYNSPTTCGWISGLCYLTYSLGMFVDMLFYNLNLRCYVVVEIKTGKFESEYIGQLGTYVAAVNHLLKKRSIILRWGFWYVSINDEPQGWRFDVDFGQEFLLLRAQRALSAAWVQAKCRFWINCISVVALYFKNSYLCRITNTLNVRHLTTR